MAITHWKGKEITKDLDFLTPEYAILRDEKRKRRLHYDERGGCYYFNNKGSKIIITSNDIERWGLEWSNFQHLAETD